MEYHSQLSQPLMLWHKPSTEEREETVHICRQTTTFMESLQTTLPVKEEVPTFVPSFQLPSAYRQIILTTVGETCLLCTGGHCSTEASR